LSTKQLIPITEYYNSEIQLDIPFSDEEVSIIENEFHSKIEILFKPSGKFFIKTQQYVGYIVLPNHTISIRPKIPQISFLNMVKYAFDIPELKPEEFELSEGDNYYDILVRFLFQQIERLLQRGLNSSYETLEENLTTVKGKILFKDNLIFNFNQPPKIYCSFAEMSQDILENRIVKYTLYYLSQCYFIDESVNAELLRYFRLFDQISLVTIAKENFTSIEYTPINQHYRTILTICELLLKDSSIDEETLGEKTAISFLIDMNKLFEKFVVNLLKEKLFSLDSNFNIDEQKREFADIQNELELRLDILINYNEQPLLILDTKYMEFEDKPSAAHLAQMNLYSDVKKVRNCGLIYPGNNSSKLYYLEKIDLNLHVIFIDLMAKTYNDFSQKCNIFVNTVNQIINSLK
jgi:5-methylcytosine-specific restriction enzyme subunit McrC